MPRPRQTVPSYVRHHNGQGRMCWRDSSGRRRFKTLPGPFNSPESLAVYHRLCLELATSPAPVLRVTDTGPTVNEVLAPYLEHARQYHGKGSDLEAVKVVVAMLRDLYGPTPAASFGPLALKATRQAMVNRQWSRQYVNRMARRVVAVFRWAASQQLLPVAVPQALGTLAPLKAGRSDAKEAPPRTAADPEHVAATLPHLPPHVTAADPEHVAATLPHLPPHVRAIVELLRLTGARPGEIVGIRWGEVDRSGDVWAFTPAKHKTSHRGKVRTILFGPAARAVIVAHLGGRVLAPDAFLFSPRRQRDERFERMRKARKSKVQPSQVSRKKAKPKRPPGETFTHRVLCHAIAKACKRAGVPKWSPYRLRHLRAAEVRAGFGIEHAKAVLGHSASGMTDHYARHADLKLAAEVAERAG